MATYAHETPSRPEAHPATGKRALIVLGGVLVLALVALGIWAIVQAVQPTELEVATDLMDEWTAAWVGNDPDAVAALFTEDGIYIDPYRSLEGRDAIRSFAEGMSPSINRGELLGEGTLAETGTIVFPMEFVFEDETWAGEVEVVFDGDLMSRFEWLHWEFQE